MKDSISIKNLEKCAKAASKRAVERAKALRIPYTVQEGKKIVEHLPDGSKRTVGTLAKAFVKPSARRFKVA